MFAGFCGANVSVASAYIADITSAENRSKGLGLIGMAFGLGFVLGPAIGGKSYEWFGLVGPGLVAAGICGVNFLLACLLLTESRRNNAAAPVQRPRWEQWKHAFGRPQLRLLILLFFLANFCFISFEVTLPLLLGSPSVKADELQAPAQLRAAFTEPVTPMQRAIVDEFRELRPEFDPDESGGSPQAWLNELNHFLQVAELHRRPAVRLDPEQIDVAKLLREAGKNGVSPRFNRLALEAAFPESIAPQHFYFDKSQISYLFVFCGLVAAAVQGGLIGRLVRLFGEPRLVWISLLVVAGAMVMIPLVSGVALLLVALALFSGGSGVNRAPTMGMISKNAGADEQGAILGVAQSVGTLARIFGPLFATTTFALQPSLPYVICAVVAVVAGFIAWNRLQEVPGNPG
jgi:MFS family permease